MRQFIADLGTNAWRTAGARYNSARRLKRREAFSTFSMTMLSAFSIAAAVVQRVYSPPQNSPLDNYITAASIALGVMLMAISLLEWGAAHGAKADALHRNAEDLTAFQLKVAHVLARADTTGTLEDQEVEALRVEYEAIKARCPFNHEPMDDRLFKAQHREAPEFGGSPEKPVMTLWQSRRVKVVWELSTVWFFLVVWAAVLVAGGYAFRIPKTGPADEASASAAYGCHHSAP